MESLSMQIDALIREYYEEYYKTQLGLPDWKSRVDLRLNEEQLYCMRFIDYIEVWLDYKFEGKKVLVVGCGTGGELVNFNSKGADVYGLEPNHDAYRISLLKAKLKGIPKNNIVRGYSEKLPYADNHFDFVYCYTVLEHVSDVRRSIEEMVRVAKPRGRIFVETPDYRQFYEGHYKLPLPMFLPKWFNKVLLKLLGRPTQLFDSLQFVNSRKLTNIFMEYPVTAFKVIRPWAKGAKWSLNIFASIRFLIAKLTGIQNNQIWIIQKNSE